MATCITYAEALANARKSELSQWSVDWSQKDKAAEFPQHAMNRSYDRFITIEGDDNLRFGRDDGLFCVGSCFARELEDAMMLQGLNPVSHKHTVAVTERRPDLFHHQERSAAHTLDPHQFNLRYSAPSMWQFIDDLLNDTLGERLLYPQRGGGCLDMQYTHGLPTLAHDPSIERRRIIRESGLAAFNEAKGFVFTLGLCEAFYDAEAERFLNITPDPRTAQNQPIFFRFLTFEENRRYIENIISAVRSRKPDAPIVFSVSPVPLHVTFTGTDIVSANLLAKSTLLAALRETLEGKPLCYYQPSYEMVLYSAPQIAWQWDKKHVSPAMVHHIVSRFIADHFGG